MTTFSKEARDDFERMARERKQREGSAKPADNERPKQSDILIKIAKRGVLFHNHEDVAFAALLIMTIVRHGRYGRRDFAAGCCIVITKRIAAHRMARP
jgi:hypothetical protein